MSMRGMLRCCMMWLGFALMADGTMAEESAPLRSFFTDEMTVHMDVPPDVLWAEIKSMYVEGNKFRRLGFDVVPVKDDPRAYLGGTRVSRVDPNSGDEDIRIAHFSTIDDEKRFLSLRAVYSSGIGAFASYQVRPEGDGSSFQLIAHGEVPVPLPADVEATQETVRKAMASVIAQHQRDLRAVWAEETSRIEAMVSGQ